MFHFVYWNLFFDFIYNLIESFIYLLNVSKYLTDVSLFVVLVFIRSVHLVYYAVTETDNEIVFIYLHKL